MPAALFWIAASFEVPGTGTLKYSTWLAGRNVLLVVAVGDAPNVMLASSVQTTRTIKLVSPKALDVAALLPLVVMV